MVKGCNIDHLDDIISLHALSHQKYLYRNGIPCYVYINIGRAFLRSKFFNLFDLIKFVQNILCAESRSAFGKVKNIHYFYEVFPQNAHKSMVMPIFRM